MICGALRQIQDTNSLGAVSRPATAHHCRLALPLSLYLSFLPSKFLFRFISVCIILQLSQLTRRFSSRRSVLR